VSKIGKISALILILTIVHISFLAPKATFQPTSPSIPLILHDDALIPQPAHIEKTSKPSRYSRYSNGGTWVPFYLGASLDPPDVELKTSDLTKLVVSFHCHGLWKYNITLNSTTYEKLTIPSAGYTNDIGNPALPMITRLVKVPTDTDLKVEILYSSYSVLDNYNVAPAQEAPFLEPNMTLPDFTLNPITYSTDAFYPTALAWIVGSNSSDPMKVRGHRIVSLSVVPVQFNPVNQSCRVYSYIEVAIKYSCPARLEPIDSRLVSPVFEEMLQGVLLNYPRQGDICPSSLNLTKQAPNEGCEYLIITPNDDDIVAAFSRLAQWKTQKGIPTEIMRISDFSSQPGNEVYNRGAITWQIRTAYDQWTPVPTYVLLVGDADSIPTRYNPTFDVSHENDFATKEFNIPSDLWYFTVDGYDYIPDFLYGRISIDTSAEANTIVDKILNYEQQGNPSQRPDSWFYENMLATALFQDDFPQDDIEDPHFLLTHTAENIWRFFDFGYDLEYNVERIFCKTNLPENSLKYEDGTEPELPQDYKWLCNSQKTTDVITAINNGRFLVFNLDHGESQNRDKYEWTIDKGKFDGWQSPSFITDDLLDLHNGRNLPVVLSIDCHCGWFDGETDFEFHPFPLDNFECFSEELLRLSGGGAVAVVASTRGASAFTAHTMLYGLIDAIWDDTDPTLASGGQESLGAALMYAKFYVLDDWGYAGGEVPTPFGELPLITIGETERTFMKYQLFGDPEMPIWTKKPQELEVTYPLEIGTSAVQSFGVKVTLKGNPNEPINSARVCLQKEGDVYEVAYTDSRGFAVFSIDPKSGGTMSVTVTAPDYLPNYNGIITVKHSHGSSLSLDPYKPGEPLKIRGRGFGSTVQLMLYTHPGTQRLNVEDIATDNGGFTFLWEVAAGDEPLTFIAKDENNWINVVCLIRRVDKPDPYMYFHGDETTWHLNTDGTENPRWDNPCIRILDNKGDLFEPAADNILQAHVDYTLEADIYNAGPVAATGVEIVFLWANFEVGQPVWHQARDPVTITVDEATEEGPGKKTVSVTKHWEENKLVFLRVRIKPQQDSRWKNNHGWECWCEWPVESPDYERYSSRSTLDTPLSLTLYNPLDSAATIFVEAKQLQGFELLWNLSLNRIPQPKLASGASETVITNFAIPTSVLDDGTQKFSINAYVNQCIIGGVEIRVRKIPPTTISIIELIIQILLTIGIPIIIIVIITICACVLRRRGR
jgi:hypothetical protein